MRIWAALLLVAFEASAAGFYFGDNGTKALLQGGAFAGQADDLTAIQHNPGGLSQLRGFHFLLDSELQNHEVSFLRKDLGATSSAANTVTNTGGLFFLPNLGLGYGLNAAGRPLTFAFGVYGPPAVGRYHYPRPNYAREAQDATRYVEHPRKYAPQRYALIENDVIILYPSLSASYELHPRASVGVSVQYVFSKFYFAQAVYSGLSTPQRMADESPEFDSMVAVDLHGKGGLTAIFGALARPTDNLAIGFSVRPPVPMRATGSFLMEPGENARKFGIEVGCPDRQVRDGRDVFGRASSGSTIVCRNAAELSLELPLEVRLGVSFKPFQPLTLNLDYVYQGWQSMDEIVLEPKDITIKVGANEPSAVSAFHIPKHWKHSSSIRLGGSWAFPFGLTAYAGALAEETAAPDEHTNIDFLHFTRVFLSAGVGYRAGPLDILAGAAYTPPVSKEIQNSEVRAGSTDPAVPGGVVGIGSYTSGGWVATLGIRGRFGGH